MYFVLPLTYHTREVNCVNSNGSRLRYNASRLVFQRTKYYEECTWLPRNELLRDKNISVFVFLFFPPVIHDGIRSLVRLIREPTFLSRRPPTIFYVLRDGSECNHSRPKDSENSTRETFSSLANKHVDSFSRLVFRVRVPLSLSPSLFPPFFSPIQNT